GEAAVLAGTVQIPERINPVTSIGKAKRRQTYVLKQMALLGFAPADVVVKEIDKPIVIGPRPPTPVGAYYAEEIRRVLLPRYGEEALMSGGLKVDIAMDPKIQGAADQAVQEGLEALDRRQGFRGPMAQVPPEKFKQLRPLIEKRMAEIGKRKGEEIVVADLTPLTRIDDLKKAALLAASERAEEGGPATREDHAEQHGPPGKDEKRPPLAAENAKPLGVDSATEVEGAEEKPELNTEDEAPPTEDEVIARAVGVKPLVEGVRTAGVVTQVDDGGKRAIVDLVSRSAQISFNTIGWARRRDENGKVSAPPQRISDVLKVGDLIRVKVTKLNPAPNLLEATLDQIPAAQAALVIVDPKDRHVLALTGGYDFTTSAFNRATQAHRQPGSSFKPFLYGAAIASQRYVTTSIVNDAPEAIRDPYTGKTWKPQNYEKGGFDGPMTLRQAITLSKNTVSVRLIEALTPQVVIDFARKAGISSPLPENLTLALGTGEVSPLEEANAYATLQSGGKYAEPILLVRVRDASGKILEEHQAAFEERIPPPVAYVTTSLMRSVVEQGTAMAVRELNRPAAGKTGTASEFRDAWFSGYTADYVATAWVGFDNHDQLGAGETGGKAALPIWLSAMKVVHDGLPPHDFEPPPGVTVVRIDPETGLLAGNSVPGREEPFLDGTQPTTEAPPTGSVRPEDFFKESSRGGM
ncbi:MAG: penicillin-binding protein 1A, partial [Myxococcaceae bacterium]